MKRKRIAAAFFGLRLLAVLALAAGFAAAQVRIVNVIPVTLSNEVNQDSEPNLAVDPSNPRRIAASAFTPDPMGGTLAPIFVSTDGGNTWVLNTIVPGGNNQTGTGDITLRFGGTSGVLYSGILRGDSFLRMNILRSNNFTAATAMTILVDRNSMDQPYTHATTVLGAAGFGRDRIYVGDNDFSVAGPGRRTASIDQHLDAVNATPPVPSGFTTGRLESRGTGTANQDGPPIRPAIHPNGTIYAIFYHWSTFTGTNATADVVVVRDDNWGQGANPFTALTDPGDTNAGIRVVQNVTIPWANFNQANFGQERLVASNITIAVDPRNSQTVYIAWADQQATTGYTLHVRRSTNGGNAWSANDLLSIGNATNPALAINIHGRIGFLYQQLTGTGANQRWETHLRRSSNGTTWDDLVLAQPLVGTPTRAFGPYLGDYCHLMAVGKDFYGIFSTENLPDNANFPNGVTYQRHADFVTHTLFAEAAHTTTVGNSIDPFFFQVTEVSPADDFYVRDWTDSPSSGDTGVEPSTHPFFYTTSDVWNRRGTLPGTFPNDQPENEEAGNGAGNIGDNWAFARIRRNALPISGSKTVTARFLVSKLGTGSNYVDAGSTDPDVSFSDPDPTVTFNATDMGPSTTAAYHWHLNAVSSTHLCLAVEISEPGDPFVAPSLVGNTPGWWTGTDLRVLLDNNKAQRNMGLSTTPARGVGASVSFFAIVHNGATFTRDIVLRYEALPQIARRFSGARIGVVGGLPRPFRSGDSITLRRVQPGENRWVSLSFPAVRGREGEVLTVNFTEMVGVTPVNGFSIGARLGSVDAVIRDVLRLHRSVFTRVAAGFGVAEAKREAEASHMLLRTGVPSPQDYVRFARSRRGNVARALQKLTRLQRVPEPFGLLTSLEAVDAALQLARADQLAVAYATLLNKLDSYLTMLQLAKGDVADIPQNIRWQFELFGRASRLARLECADTVRRSSEKFLREYAARRVRTKDYPEFIRGLLDCFRDTTRASWAMRTVLGRRAQQIERNLDDPVALQKAHREFLLALQSLAR